MLQNVAPFWLIGFAVIAAALVVMRLLLLGSGGRWRPARLWQIHRDEVGSVQSLSFVLTLPLFIMIMMGIVQASQLMIAKVVVEYSAIAAARSASVWVPVHMADYDEEGRNRIGLLVPGETTADGRFYELGGPETHKIFRIRMAAVQACMPIAPSRSTGYSTAQEGGEAYASLIKAYLALVPDEPNREAVARRLKNKLAYSLANTQIGIKIFHPNVDPSLRQIYDDSDQIDHNYVVGMLPGANPGDPPIPDYGEQYTTDAVEFQSNEIDWQDVITVTVHHDLALLPGPGRMLARLVYSQSGQTDEVSGTIRLQGENYIWPLTATASASSEGQKSILRYDHHFTGRPY
jgi:hypothetical protein